MPPEHVEDPENDHNLDIGDDEEGHHIKFEVSVIFNIRERESVKLS